MDRPDRNARAGPEPGAAKYGLSFYLLALITSGDDADLEQHRQPLVDVGLGDGLGVERRLRVLADVPATVDVSACVPFGTRSVHL